jgi:hypothetical protein
MPVILVGGIADEGPTALVIEALEAMGAHYRVFDQRRAASSAIMLEIAGDAEGGVVGGTLTIDGDPLALETVRGFYVRVMDDNLLPGIRELAPDAPDRQRCRRLHELLLQFADIVPARVLNRPAAMGSNQSKPFQAHAIRACGFDIPETLITNHPDTAREFVERVWSEGDAAIYKSVSGVRSIVQKLEPRDLARLDRIRWCPTQFQRHVTGTDVRVHVVGQTVLAASIASDATDYRYATRQTGVDAVIAAAELDPATSMRCVRLAQRLELPLAGIDLRRMPDGRHVCFEVNPSPAFSFYEQRTGLPIAAAIARYLAGDAD